MNDLLAPVGVKLLNTVHDGPLARDRPAILTQIVITPPSFPGCNLGVSIAAITKTSVGEEDTWILWLDL